MNIKWIFLVYFLCWIIIFCACLTFCETNQTATMAFANWKCSEWTGKRKMKKEKKKIVENNDEEFVCFMCAKWTKWYEIVDSHSVLTMPIHRQTVNLCFFLSFIHRWLCVMVDHRLWTKPIIITIINCICMPQLIKIYDWIIRIPLTRQYIHKKCRTHSHQFIHSISTTINLTFVLFLSFYRVVFASPLCIESGIRKKKNEKK